MYLRSKYIVFQSLIEFLFFGDRGEGTFHPRIKKKPKPKHTCVFLIIKFHILLPVSLPKAKCFSALT